MKRRKYRIWYHRLFRIQSPSFFDYDALATEIDRIGMVVNAAAYAAQTRDARALRGD